MTGPPQYTDVCWPADVSCCTDWDTFDPDVQTRALALATTTLRALTAYRVGGCPITVRPCRQGCNTPFLASGYTAWMGGGYGPMIWNGAWINVACGCVRSCECTTVCEVLLPPPVGFVQSVQIDGVVLPETWYRVDNGRRLVWQGDLEVQPFEDAEGRIIIGQEPVEGCGWPLCQDMNLPDGAVGTFSVTYLNALPVDGAAAYAAGVLACEFAQAACGQGCRLPPGVVQVVRQGVSYQVNPGTFPGGVTGIPEVDAWIQQINPYHRKMPTGVWSPDVAEPRITTWTAPP